MAGVMNPSPKSSPAPSIRDQSRNCVPRFLYSCSNPYSAKTPPSPSFCARRTKMAYLIATMIVMVQITREIPPSTLSARQSDPGMAEEELVQRVQRRRADVAVDDPHRPDRQRGETTSRRLGRGAGRFF